MKKKVLRIIFLEAIAVASYLFAAKVLSIWTPLDFYQACALTAIIEFARYKAGRAFTDTLRDETTRRMIECLNPPGNVKGAVD